MRKMQEQFSTNARDGAYLRKCTTARVRGRIGAANGPTGMLALDFKRSMECVAKKQEVERRRRPKPRSNFPLKILINGCRLRQKRTKKPSLPVVGEHFEFDFNTATPGHGARLRHPKSLAQPLFFIFDNGPEYKVVKMIRCLLFLEYQPLLLLRVRAGSLVVIVLNPLSTIGGRLGNSAINRSFPPMASI